MNRRAISEFFLGLAIFLGGSFGLFWVSRHVEAELVKVISFGIWWAVTTPLGAALMICGMGAPQLYDKNGRALGGAMALGQY